MNSSVPSYKLLRLINDSITAKCEKFSCGCDKFDKFVTSNEKAIARELNAQKVQSDCDSRSEHCGSMLHYLTTGAMISVLHKNGLHLYNTLDKQLDIDKAKLLELPSTSKPLEIRKTPRSANLKASSSRFRAKTDFLLPRVQTITM